MKRFACLLLLMSVSLPAMAQGEPWEIDTAHSSAQFSVRHMMVSNVRGEFSKVTGAVILDEKNISLSSVKATLDATTINTREPRRDDHLKSADFFDVAKFPTLSFESRKVMPAGPGKLKVVGDLTMHGVTREVTLDVSGPTEAIKDPRGTLRRGVSASTQINRKDFGLAWNRLLETGGMVVGEEVAITIDLELTKKTQ
jgi:polyisoprenoid-binding protein YceI